MGAIDAACKRVDRNYKVAVPSYFFSRQKLQLLLPLCLESPNVADLALVLELDEGGNCYRAATCLEISQAIQNARLIASPDRNWLGGTPNEILGIPDATLAAQFDEALYTPEDGCDVTDDESI